jgi:hypothetical protein
MGGHLEPDHWVKICRVLVRFNDQAALLVSVIITDQHKYEVIKHGDQRSKRLNINMAPVQVCAAIDQNFSYRPLVHKSTSGVIVRWVVSQLRKS